MAKRFDARRILPDQENPSDDRYRIYDMRTEAYLCKTDDTEYRANLNRAAILEYYLNRDCFDDQPDEIREFISRPVWQ